LGTIRGIRYYTEWGLCSLFGIFDLFKFSTFLLLSLPTLYQEFYLAMVAPTSSAVTFTASPIDRSRSIGRASHLTQWTPRLVGIIVGILILGLGNAAMALQRGEHGTEVSDLQTMMRSAGCYEGPVTGNFGSLTEAGVMACQDKFSLTVDGVAGRDTIAALKGQRLVESRPYDGLANPTPLANPIANPNQSANSRENILQNGREGATVSQLQTKLKQLNFYTGSIDGVYGNQTEEAVRRFQRTVQLPVDGRVGTQELEALGNYQPPAPIAASPVSLSRNQLTLGDDHPDVGQLQDKLRSAGYFQGDSTQYYGSITRQSVIDFQRSRGLTVTGIADATTLQSLGLQPGATLSQSYWKDRNGFTTAHTNTSVQSLQKGPASPNARYIVVIPKQADDTLYQVRRVVRSAQAYQSGKGDYIAAGTYTKRLNAEKRSNYLRSIGFDARVDYQ
jgi:peptidoglycan hydrolase-like protein with peptidoglycan-binding domain